MTNRQTESPFELRRRAEEKFGAKEVLFPEACSPEEAAELLHDLHVHQIELEIQNEELRRNQHELEISQRRYFSLYNQAPVGYLTINEQGLIQEANLAISTMLGVEREDLLKKPITKYIFRDDQTVYYLQRKKVLEENEMNAWEMRLLRVNGSVFWVKMRVTPALGGEHLVTATDITERRQAEAALQEMANSLSEQFIKVQQANDLLEQKVEERTEELRESEKFTLDVIDSLTFNISVLDSCGMIVAVNEPWRNFTQENCSTANFSEDVGKMYLSVCKDSIGIVDDEGANNAFIGISSVLQGEQDCFSMEYPCHSPDEQRWFLLNVSKLRGSRHGAVVSHIDITKRKWAEQALEESNRRLEILCITDGLTGIANRRHFDEVLLQEHARHTRSRAELSLILLDIDHFKPFNDSYGHVAGDDCLRKIGQVIAECTTRAADLASRYGGEEFACILPETDIHGAVAIAEQIRTGILALAIPHIGSNVADYVTASLGVVTVQCAEKKSVVDIVAQADDLLYRAKSCGRNRVEFDATPDEAWPSVEGISANFVQLVWKDNFCSGNQLIDSQHQSLFLLSNRLLEMILSDRSSAEISPTITRLLDDASQHFHDEEAILKAAGFPDLGQHSAEHAKLLKKGLELSREFVVATISAGNIFQFLVYEVVMQHMLGADRAFFPFISNSATSGLAAAKDSEENG